MNLTHNRVIAYAALGLASAALVLSVTHAGPAGTAGTAGRPGVAGPAGQVSSQDGFCYNPNSEGLVVLYSPSNSDGVESCYLGGSFVSIVPTVQQ